MSNFYGYVCIPTEFNGKGVVSNKHGYCEMFEKELNKN